MIRASSLAMRAFRRLAVLTISTSFAVFALTVPTFGAEISIPAQPLSTALKQLAAQSGAEIIFTPNLVGSLQSKAISGSYGVEEALTILLAGSGLTFEKRADTGLILIRQKNSILDSPDDGPEKSPRALAMISEEQPEEIIVTAQRRSERLQDVPIAVTAVSSDTLDKQGIRSSQYLPQTVPGLSMNKVGATLLPAIRGVTTLIAVPGGSPNIATYLDGVYQPLGQATDYKFPDIERVEILKGPQGSLYGRNATGGAISYITVEPKFRPTGTFSAEYGSFNTVDLRAFVSGPLIADRLAASLSASYDRSDGYIRNVITGKEANPNEFSQFRGKILWSLSDQVKFEFVANHIHENDPTAHAGTVLNGNSAGAALGAIITSKPNTYSGNNAPVQKDRQDSGVGKLTADIGFATLTTTSSYLYDDQTYVSDGDRSSVQLAEYLGPVDKQSIFQQDILLTSNGSGKFKWLLGGNYFFHNSLSMIGVDLAGGIHFALNNRVHTYSRSVFGELTIPIISRLSAIAGYRFTSDSETLRAIAAVGGSSTEPFPLRGQNTWTKGIPRFTLRYEFTPNTNVYATFSQGFKSGLFATTTFVPVEPETLTAYQIGLKTGELPGGISLHTEAFHYDYKNQQVQSIVNIHGAPIGDVQNVGHSEMYGLDGDLTVPITSDFSVLGGFSLLHAVFLDFPNAVVDVPKGTGGNLVVTLPNAKGNVSPSSPKWTLSLTGQYAHEFAAGALDASASLYHVDTVFFDNNNRVTQGPRTTLDASVAWVPDGTHWRVALSGHNLTDEAYIIGAFITSLVDSVNYAMPRSVDVKVQYSF